MAEKKTNEKRSVRSKGGKRLAKSPKKPKRREIGGWVCLVLGLLTLLSCFGIQAFFTNIISSFDKGLIGAGFYALPFSFILSFIILVTHDGRPVRLRVTCSFLVSLLVGTFVHLIACKQDPAWGFYQMFKEFYITGGAGTSGGIFAGFLGKLLTDTISKVGAFIVVICAFFLTLLTSLNLTIPGIIRAIRNRPRLEYDEPKTEHPDPAEVIVNHVAQAQAQRAEHKAERRKRDISDFDVPVDDPIASPAEQKRKKLSPDAFLMQQENQQRQKVKQSAKAGVPVTSEPSDFDEDMLAKPLMEEEPQKITKEDVREATQDVTQEINEKESEEAPTYIFPPIDLLSGAKGGAVDGSAEMRLNTERLNATLKSFNIDAHIVDVVRGPSVTRYELKLDPGVKFAKITGLADDIALALGATGVRISPIPDKESVVGVEVPNREVSTVVARDVIDSQAFKGNKSPIAFAVGKDIGGNCVVGDIAKLPHMLIAGTTGSGKSVCMNSLIVSLLYRATPDEVKLIMVDPKMVELGVYNPIPHLLIPVVTDPKKAAGSLQWAVNEMLRRYRMMADSGVRDLDSYNKIAKATPDLETMPRIVVVIDELADLMLVAAKEVEESICRIAQMGRASGIHLVIATQRPSADVITGLMKANIPSRIAFAVASAMESRIILDTQGAEKLVGKGDMLYAPLGQGKPKRVQGCFITDEEVQNVVNAIKNTSSTEYDSEVMDQIEKNAAQSGTKQHNSDASSSETDSDGEYDEMLTQAVDVILEIGQASVSMLQRRLKLGYARAARIVDEMEERGIVGPYSGSKPRDILVTKEQWEAMKNGTNEPVEELIE